MELDGFEVFEGLGALEVHPTDGPGIKLIRFVVVRLARR